MNIDSPIYRFTCANPYGSYSNQASEKKNSIDNNNRKMEWVEKRANEIATENREQQ